MVARANVVEDEATLPTRAARRDATTRLAAVETGRAVAAAVRVNMARVGVAAREPLKARPDE